MAAAQVSGAGDRGEGFRHAGLEAEDGVLGAVLAVDEEVEAEAAAGGDHVEALLGVLRRRSRRARCCP